jgi:hypothetical protein
MSEYNLPGKPLRLHEFDFLNFTKNLYDKGIKFSNGKRVGEDIQEGKAAFIGLSAGQLEVLSYDARFKVLAAGRRYGKTVSCVLLALAALLQPNRLVIVVGPEHAHVDKIFKELYSILVTQLQLANKGTNDGTIVRNTKGDQVIQLKNGSRVEGKSGTNPDSLAGDAVDLYIFDEAALDANLDNIWGIARPALADKKGSAVFISSPRGRNDFYRLYKLGQKGMGQSEGYIPIKDDNMTEWASWSFPSSSNPFIPPEEYEKAKREAIEKGKYESFKQEWDADFDAVTDVAFPEFRAFKRVKDDKGIVTTTPHHVQHYTFDPRNGPWFSACDFNVARPASTVYIQIDHHNNIIIFDELFRPATDAKLQAQFILEKQEQLGVPYKMVFGDVAGGFSRSGVNEFTLMEGVLGHSPYAERQSRDSGNHLLHQFLAVPLLDKYGKLILDEYGVHQTYPKLFIASHCVETIHALEAAKRKMGKDGSIKDDYTEFKTGHEGLLDAIRYALVCIFKPKNGMQVFQGR